MPLIKPTKSNTADIGCSPTSSNCVIWQGADLPCLKLCTGDTVSDVVYKLATEICNLSSVLDLSNLDLSGVGGYCVPTITPSTYQLIDVLSFITKEIVCLSNKIPANLQNEPLITTNSTCFELQSGISYSYYDTINALINTISNLLGTNACSYKGSYLDYLTSQINQLNTTTVATNQALNATNNNIILLQDAFIISTPSSCFSAKTQNTSGNTDLDTMVTYLDQRVCELIGNFNASPLIQTGDICGTASVTAAINKGIPFNGNTVYSLSQPTIPYSSLTGWVTTNTALGDSVGNMWMVLQDIYTAVKLIQDNCCKISCNSIVINFNPTFDLVAKTVTLDFTSSSIPLGFVDGGSLITITDQNGVAVNVRTKSGTTAPLIVTTPTSTTQSIANNVVIPINGLSTGKLLVSITLNFSSGTLTCNACISGDINYVNPSCCSITNTGSTSVTLTIKTC